jgi:pyruvate-formate lyase-activating enzyme
MAPQPPVSIAHLRHRYLEPNFTAILPGVCQAHCRFCIEPEGPPPPTLAYWVEQFEQLMLHELPPLFRIVSISGGEPTLSAVFPQTLDVLGRARAAGRLHRVVLTTNGSPKSILKHIDDIGRAVTHVNISRHASDDEDNAKVFKTTKVPTTEELRDIISLLNRRGLLVNLNCVYSGEHLFGQRIKQASTGHIRAEAKRFISFARAVGASSVVFRHDHRVWDERPTALEQAFEDYAVQHRAACASCRVIGKVIRGVPVNFKKSAYEPMQHHIESELYELVFHSDGTLYRDWSRAHPIQRPLPAMLVSEPFHSILGSHVSSRPMVVVPECEERVSP